jgi:outer membrane protein assembly factor BamB
MAFNQGNVRAVMVFKGKALVALKVADGAEMWRIPWEAGWDINAATPLIAGDRFFISCGWDKGRGGVFQLAEGGPKLLWDKPNPDVKFKLGSGALHNGHIYGVSQEGYRLLCIEFASGQVAWSKEGFGDKNAGEGTATIAGGRLIALTPAGELVIAEATHEAYKEIARAKVLPPRCWVCPVLANGRIYCRNNSGDVVCLDVRK